MDISYIEKAAEIIFRMCREHPEICPHDYEWISTLTKDGIEIESYRCGLCGKKITKEKPL